MKKIIAVLTLSLAGCTVLRSPYLSQQVYWGNLVLQTGIAAKEQGVLAYEANKNGKKDSAEIYTSNFITLTALGKQYTDSLLYYINKH